MDFHSKYPFFQASALLLLNVVFTYLSYKLYMEFGWKIYKRVRFNIRLRGKSFYWIILLILLKKFYLIYLIACMLDSKGRDLASYTSGVIMLCS